MAYNPAAVGNLLPAQVPGANRGPRNARSLAESNLAVDMIYAQTELSVRQKYEAIIGALATMRETDNASMIVANFMDEMIMRTSAEGGPRQYLPAELQAYLAVGRDVKRTVKVSAKLINRGDPTILNIETDKVNVSLVRELAAFILNRILKLHRPSSQYKPHGMYVEPEHIARLHMDAFNSVGGVGKTQRFANAVSRAMQHIGSSQHTAKYIVMPETMLPFIETGELVAMSSDFVDDDGFLARSVSDNYTPTYGRLPIVLTLGDENDPLVGQARVLQHFCNGGNACDSGNRTIRIQDIVTGKDVAVDLEAAIDALRAFGPDGEVSDQVSEVITKYGRDGQTMWHKKNATHDPYRSQEMGVWTYTDQAGNKQQTRRFGQIPISRRRQEGFAKSVLAATGVSGLEPALTKLEALLKDIHRQTPPDSYWNAITAVNTRELVPRNNDEAGARRDALGNPWGVLNHPSVISTSSPGYTANRRSQNVNFLAGYGTGAGLKYLAEAGRGRGPAFDKIAEVVDACEVVGGQLAAVLPGWASGPIPAWFHGLDYTPGMRLIDSIIAGGVNVFTTTATGDQRVKGFTPRGTTGAEEYIDLIARELADDIYGTPVAGTPASAAGITPVVAAVPASVNVAVPNAARDNTAQDVQAELVNIAGTDASLKQAVLPVLNQVAALAVSGTNLAGIASFDVRAAIALADGNEDSHLTALQSIIGAWQGSAASTVEISVRNMPSTYIAGSTTIIRKYAAAVVTGNSPVDASRAFLSGNDLARWYAALGESGMDEAVAVALLNSRDLNDLTPSNTDDAGRTRLPLVLSGISASRVTLGTNQFLGTSAVPFGQTQVVATFRASDDLFASSSIGAQYGAGSSSVPAAPVGQTFSEENESAVEAENKRQARMLKVPYKIIVLSMFQARLTAGNLRGMFASGNIDAPVALLLVRAPFFERVEHVIITMGSEANEIVHEPIRVHQHYTGDAEFFEANVIVTAAGVVRAPGASSVLPNARVERPVRHTADCSFMDENGHGALMPILVSRDWDCPDALDLSGIDQHGNLLLPSAPIVHALWENELRTISNPDFLWGEKGVSYHGDQTTYDHDGGAREMVSAGSYTDVYHRNF